MKGDETKNTPATKMGSELSNEHEIYFQLLQQLLKTEGCQVKKLNLINLLQMVKTYPPWFPDKGSLDLEVWEKVGQKLKWHQENGTLIYMASEFINLEPS